MTAMACVGVVTLSGLWLYWTHVGAISQLRSSLYGRSLTVKLVLVALLVALGGFNHLWLKLRVEGMHATHNGSRINSLVDRHFRGVVAVEVLLGVGVLFVVPYLSGSARNQVFQTKIADISQTKTAGAAIVKFTPSGLQPGLTNYDVTVPVWRPRVSRWASFRRRLAYRSGPSRPRLSAMASFGQAASTRRWSVIGRSM